MNMSSAMLALARVTFQWAALAEEYAHSARNPTQLQCMSRKIRNGLIKMTLLQCVLSQSLYIMQIGQKRVKKCMP